ncbi:MAG: hypothetical protein E7301_02355 [Butyrivibrio sp.]|nr:hypothetical protein [Butyrivibrio sp.]
MDGLITLLIVGLLLWKFAKPLLKNNGGVQVTKNFTPQEPVKRVEQTKPVKKYEGAMNHREPSAMPHKHRENGVYDTANKHKRDNSDGTIPHSHVEEKRKHIDAASLPPGFILLNGEPVRTKDLENY